MLERFADAVSKGSGRAMGAQPEEQLKRPVRELLEAAGKDLSLKVETWPETRVEGLGARPDIGVGVNGLLAGHVELKRPGIGARVKGLKGRDREQWGRLKELPNLIYTDANEWALYRTGELAKGPVRLGDDLVDEGAAGLRADAEGELRDLLRDFLLWEPIVPSTPRGLAQMLAPLCKLLRDEVLELVGQEGSTIRRVSEEFREVLFPDAGDFQFADSYAQTVTYALLLARFEGADRIDVGRASTALERRHGLLARILRLLGDPSVREEVRMPLQLLERAVDAVDVKALTKKGRDPWLYFYEDFLAAYDPKLRRDRGVYYTPPQVIQAQCRLVAELLRDRFRKRLAYAEPEVILLDPAAGTGAYPLQALDLGLELTQETEGPGAVPGRASLLARNLHAFEILVGPYAVAHLRITQGVRERKGELPEDGVHVYLTDTLEAPHSPPKGQTGFGFMYEPLAEEHRRAQVVKEQTRVLVCIGNPPYDRQQLDPEEEARERKGGWIRFGDDGKGKNALLEDFLRPAREAGKGVHLKNLYNDYVYFWRWALWKVFEATDGPGIVSFITASSYLRGPGFVGMRQHMRQTFDELWVLDLEGDSLGARKTQNVFNIQTPVAIAVGVRYGDPQPDQPAKVWYTKITGTREEKLAQLAEIQQFEDLDWKPCFEDWTKPLLPEGEGDYFSWPLLTDLFPWQVSGVQYKRTWPIGVTKELLTGRWEHLLSLPEAERKVAFRETRDRKIDRTYPPLTADADRPPAITTLGASAPPPPIECYSFRSFDRQWVIADSRVADFIRPVLWRTQSPRQIYMTTLLSTILGEGPAATVAAAVPDLHHFRGSFGGKDVIPLWRNLDGTEPNVTVGLLDAIRGELKRQVGPEDLFAYAYGILPSASYVERFSEELSVPGPGLPITKEPELFEETVALGRHLIWLHTYGERFAPGPDGEEAIPPGRAKIVKPISGAPSDYPEEFAYDPETQTLRVGDGEVAPVPQEVWEFSVSGLQVVSSWLGYRMKKRAGRSSSPLDEIRPERWTSELNTKLLELLWVLEATIALLPELERNLAAVLDGPLFAADELPQPSDDERAAPKPRVGSRRMDPELDLRPS